MGDAAVGADGPGGDGAFVFEFASPVPVFALNDVDWDRPVVISPDGTTMLIASIRAGGVGAMDLWSSTRTSGLWGAPSLRTDAGLNSTTDEWGATISSDEQELYLASNRGGNSDIWRAIRATPSAPLSMPTLVGPVSSSTASDWGPTISADGLELYFTSARGGNMEVWRSTRTAGGTAGFGAPQLVPELSSPAAEWEVFLAADGLSMLLSSERIGTAGGSDLWVATRANAGAPFSQPVNLADVNSPAAEINPVLSADGRELYFARTGPAGDYDIYVANAR